MSGHDEVLERLADADRSWMKRGACQDIENFDELFFPEPGGDGGAAAKKICRGCPVAAACLEYALRTRQEHGVWAATTGKQRQRMWRQNESSVRADPTATDSTLVASPAPKRGKARTEFTCARCDFGSNSWAAMERHADEHRHGRIKRRLEAS